MLHDSHLAPQQRTLKALIKLRVKLFMSGKVLRKPHCVHPKWLFIWVKLFWRDYKSLYVFMCLPMKMPWQIWRWVLVNLAQVIQTDRTLAAVAVTQIFLSEHHDKRTCFWVSVSFLFKGSQPERFHLKLSNTNIWLEKYVSKGRECGLTAILKNRFYKD